MPNNEETKKTELKTITRPGWPNVEPEHTAEATIEEAKVEEMRQPPPRCGSFPAGGKAGAGS